MKILVFNYLQSGEQKKKNPFKLAIPSNRCLILPLKRQVKFVADDIQNFFFYFSEKTSLDISCESSAKQMIHMKC